jgi:FixJ family two-component response regulator
MTRDATVLVVDDDRSVRTALSRALRAAGYAVEAFADAAGALAALPAVAGPCCVVSDVRMPGMDGLGLQGALRAQGAPVALLFLSGVADVRTSVRAMKDGALDFLQKPISTRALLEAVEAAVGKARSALEDRRKSDDLQGRYRTLTPRERQVFALVTSGLLNKQVGFELGTSEKTVKVQRARVIEKMGAHSLADLVRMADRLGIRPTVDAITGPWAQDAGAGAAAHP